MREPWERGGGGAIESKRKGVQTKQKQRDIY